jgi:hypothetical protein
VNIDFKSPIIIAVSAGFFINECPAKSGFNYAAFTR